jgi:lysophospholipase L1-like esterase
MRHIPFLFFFFLFSACVPLVLQTASPAVVQPSLTPVPPVSILSLGDSYTIGQGVEPGDRYPNQLAQRLSESGYSLVDPVILAQSGWTTANLLQAIEDDHPPGTYDLVTLLIGVNNQFRGQSIERYGEEFSTLLDIATAYARGEVSRVIVLSIPDWGASPYASGYDGDQVAAQIDLFNQVNLLQTKTRGARYVDITPVTRRLIGDTEAFAVDGLHPSGYQYSLWVEIVLPVALQALQDPD